MARKSGHRGEREISCKNHRAGNAGRTGVTVVTNSRVFFCTRGCGRFGRPAFPAPLVSEGGTFKQNSRERCGEIAKLYLTVIPKKLASRELDTSVGVSGPHDFAVRAQCHSSFDITRVHRIPHPTSVTIAIRPSCGCGMAIDMQVIWV